MHFLKLFLLPLLLNIENAMGLEIETQLEFIQIVISIHFVR